MVTTTSPPGATDAGEMDLLALAPPAAASTVTLVSPPTSWSALSESLKSPEKS